MPFGTSNYHYHMHSSSITCITYLTFRNISCIRNSMFRYEVIRWVCFCHQISKISVVWMKLWNLIANKSNYQLIKKSIVYLTFIFFGFGTFLFNHIQENGWYTIWVFFQDSILNVGFLLTVNGKCINHARKNYFSKFIVFIKLRKECRKLYVWVFFHHEFMWMTSFIICFSYLKFSFCSWSNYKSRSHLKC